MFCASTTYLFPLLSFSSPFFSSLIIHLLPFAPSPSYPSPYYYISFLCLGRTVMILIILHLTVTQNEGLRCAFASQYCARATTRMHAQPAPHAHYTTTHTTTYHTTTPHHTTPHHTTPHHTTPHHTTRITRHKVVQEYSMLNGR
jgi:hypothetical protein